MAAPLTHTLIHHSTPEGDRTLRLVNFCPECHTGMKARKQDGPWNENEHLTVIPTVCPKCGFGGNITINHVE
jgi:hypothetical protein